MMNLPIHGERAGSWLKLDCRHYRGDRPCRAGIHGVCPVECASYERPGARILLIKLGALGDVIRTAALLPGLKARWPNSQITWVTRENGVRALTNHPQIDRLLVLDAETLCHLEHERFDLCLSLDKEPGPAALAMRVDAREKRGIGLSAHGTPFPLNPECVPYFLLGLDDELKYRHNQKPYPQLIYEAVGLTYGGQRYELHPGPEDRARAAGVWARAGVGPGEIVVGLNTGAGSVFANKNWPAGKYLRLAECVIAQNGWRVALLGGPEERALNANLAAACPGAIDTGCEHSALTFAALVARCDVVVTGDTMGMHVAIAAGVPVVALFGPTCAQEIELYGRGERVVTGLACSPCYRRRCDKSPNCTDEIPVDRVLTAVQRWVVEGARLRPQVVPAEVLA